MEKQKRALAIEDISCVGRCSLTVALPVLCAAGIDASILPTAVLSTHTGGFTGYTFRDLTEDIAPIAAHWRSLNLQFDAIKTGYLGSLEQISLVDSLISEFRRPETLVLVDPVMGDNGKLYAHFSADFPAHCRSLCRQADILVPNLSEASFLLDSPYLPGPHTEAQIREVLQRLAELGPRHIVLTGVHFNESELGAACYDTQSGSIEYAFAPRIEGFFHGSGDVFACSLLDGLLLNMPLPEAVQLAVDFTQHTVALTAALAQERRYGVCFERALPMLMKRLGLV